MKLEGRALVIRQDDVDTDVLYPGAYLNITDVEAMKPHLFEGLDPSLRDRLGADTVLVVGENFGSGSSREHVPQVGDVGCRERAHEHKGSRGEAESGCNHELGADPFG